MAKIYDVIVVGAGHNGLVTAAYVAKSGLKVLVVEKRSALGGMAVTEEAFPGYRFDTLQHSLGWVHPSIVRDLELTRHGLEVQPTGQTVFTPLPDGGHLSLWQDTTRSVEAIRKFSKKDADKWPAFVDLVALMASVLETIESAAMPNMPAPSPAELLSLAGAGRRLQQLSAKDRPEFLRFIPISIFELLNDWFETGVLKGTLGAAGITALMQGPRATGTGLNFLHHQVGGPKGAFRATRLVRGGLGNFAESLASAARAHGAEIRAGTEAKCVVVNEGRATGVALSSGEEVGAQRIVSAADPRRTFFELVDPIHLQPDFMRGVVNLKMRGCVAKVNLALGELPAFTGYDGGDAGLSGTISISPDLDYLERAYDDAKYGRISDRPYLECVIPSLSDPGRAPAGRHVMSIWAQFAPYHLRGDWATEKDRLADVVISTLAAYAPNLTSSIIHRQVLSPVDIEREFALTEGSLTHGEMMLEHLFFMRPVPGWAQYRTPIAGLYLCGAGTHPGSGITGRPGFNAAREILADARRDR